MKHRRAEHLTRWRRSPEFLAIARAAFTKFNREYWRRPKCGARRKRDGAPCQLPGLENGKCRLHGGRTPKGRNWHRLALPAGSSPAAVKKLERKLRDHERRRKQREARLDAMPPEDRERYRAWLSAHHPDRSERQRARYAREARERIARMLQDEEAEPAQSNVFD